MNCTDYTYLGLSCVPHSTTDQTPLRFLSIELIAALRLPLLPSLFTGLIILAKTPRSPIGES
jgi:hypothetical protein